MELLTGRPIEVGAEVVYHGRKRQVHVAFAFALVGHYQAVFT